jgi:L-aspartate semialdehyde sulfurtransferase ferredoxin
MLSHPLENERLENDAWYRWRLFEAGSGTHSRTVDPCTQLRLTLVIPVQAQPERIISRLITDYGLTVNLVRTVFTTDKRPEQYDLRLSGSIAQIQTALAYFASLHLTIKGRANPDGDSWYY